MTTWRDRAICRSLDPDIFFPRTGDISGIDYARQICAGCPVVQECLDAAMEAEHGTGKDSRAGVFGGLSSSQRYDRYRKSVQRTGGKLPAECGTYAAYLRHHRYGETPCAECREAGRLKSAAKREQARGPVECGTRRGYHRHWLKGEPACDPCRHANATADRRLRTTGSTLPAA